MKNHRAGNHNPQSPHEAEQSSGPESIDAIVKRWLKAHRVPRRLDRDLIASCWSQVVGASLASHARAVDLKAGVLVVEVDSAPLLHELSTYQRSALVASLRDTDGLGAVRDIRFRSGTF